MKTRVIQEEPDDVIPPAARAQAPVSNGSRAGGRPKIILGALLAFLGLAVIVAGGALMAVHATNVDALLGIGIGLLAVGAVLVVGGGAAIRSGTRTPGP